MSSASHFQLIVLSRSYKLIDMKNDQLHTSMSRRGALGLSALLSAWCLSWPAHARSTPSAAEGPYYPLPSMRFADSDNDLVHVKGRSREANGEIIWLKGRILDRLGKPAAAARIEIWQTDVNGRYLHTGDPRHQGFDKTFQGFGQSITDRSGAYIFRTIKPASYPGRTPHIHVKIYYGSQTLTTQFYLAGHPANERDFLYRRLSADQRKSVEMNLIQSPMGIQTKVDIYL